MAEPFITVSSSQARGFTNALLDLVAEGVMDRDALLQDLLLWMSEYEVQDFCEANLMLRDDDNECVIRKEQEVDEYPSD